jgi:hypothetical protein
MATHVSVAGRNQPLNGLHPTPWIFALERLLEIVDADEFFARV